MNNHNQKLIIDTDAGHDDALALMLLVKSQVFDIQAITTVAGNSTIENVTRNTRFILNLLKDNSTPIYSGMAKPLSRTLTQAVVHGSSGLDGVDMTGTKYKLSSDAPDQIITLIEKYPRQITILTLGPLSNIARALLKKPQIISSIKKIVIMGGAINVSGNKNRVAEFNMFVDPEAADIMFRAQVPKILIPLDPCNKIVIPLNKFQKLKNTDLYMPIMGMMKKFIKGIKKYEGTKGALVYDAVAAYYLLNPKAFHLEPMDILIETKGVHTSGMTVVEKRILQKKNYNIDVAMKVDRKLFIKDLLKILKK